MKALNTKDWGWETRTQEKRVSKRGPKGTLKIGRLSFFEKVRHTTKGGLAHNCSIRGGTKADKCWNGEKRLSETERRLVLQKKRGWGRGKDKLVRRGNSNWVTQGANSQFNLYDWERGGPWPELATIHGKKRIGYRNMGNYFTKELRCNKETEH